MIRGWIKLYRRSLDSVTFQNANLWQVWCWCLMKAAHEEKKILWNGQEIILKPGQFLSGRFTGSKECRMRPSTFRNQIALLKRLENLDMSSDSRSSLITVVKWNEFQGNGTLKKETRTGKRTPGGQPKDTIKNIENVKKIKEKIMSLVSDFPSLDNDAFRSAWDKWYEYLHQKRKSLVLMTAEQQLKMLSRVPDPIGMIEFSILQGYTGLFSPKEKNNGNNRSENKIQRGGERDIELVRRRLEKVTTSEGERTLPALAEQDV